MTKLANQTVKLDIYWYEPATFKQALFFPNTCFPVAHAFQCRLSDVASDERSGRTVNEENT